MSEEHLTTVETALNVAKSVNAISEAEQLIHQFKSADYQNRIIQGVTQAVMSETEVYLKGFRTAILDLRARLTWLESVIQHLAPGIDTAPPSYVLVPVKEGELDQYPNGSIVAIIRNDVRFGWDERNASLYGLTVLAKDEEGPLDLNGNYYIARSILDTVAQLDLPLGQAHYFIFNELKHGVPVEASEPDAPSEQAESGATEDEQGTA